MIEVSEFRLGFSVEYLTSLLIPSRPSPCSTTSFFHGASRPFLSPSSPSPFSSSSSSSCAAHNPRSPTNFPPRVGSHPHRSLRSLSQQHGPVMLLHFGRVPAVVVSSATAAQEVMKTQDVVFATRPDSSMADRLLYGSKDITFAKYGDYWRQLRRICVVHLLSLRRVHSFRPIRQEEVALLVDSIRAASGPVNISEMVIAFTSDIVCRVAFGRKYPEEMGGVGASLAELMALLGAFPVRDFIPLLGWVDWLSGLDARVKKTAIDLDAFMEKVIEEHASEGERNDDHDHSSMNLVDILLSLVRADGSEGFSLSRDNMKAIILDIFAGGTDTTYATIEWAMAELVRHPTKMKRVQEEIRKIVGLKEEIREETVQEIEYLKAVIKETLRLHPIVPLLLPRESMQDTHLLGYHIPKGTRVIINAWANGRDPVSWEKPEEFWPERFLDNSIDFKGEDFQYTPFGGGRRSCPGMDFAVPIAELALANLLYHFDWELPEGMKGEEMDMSEFYGILMRKKSSLILVGKPPKHKVYA